VIWEFVHVEKVAAAQMSVGAAGPSKSSSSRLLPRRRTSGGVQHRNPAPMHVLESTTNVSHHHVPRPNSAAVCPGSNVTSHIPPFRTYYWREHASLNGSRGSRGAARWITVPKVAEKIRFDVAFRENSCSHPKQGCRRRRISSTWRDRSRTWARNRGRAARRPDQVRALQAGIPLACLHQLGLLSNSFAMPDWEEQRRNCS